MVIGYPTDIPPALTNSATVEFTTNPDEFIIKANVQGRLVTRVATSQDLVKKLQEIYKDIQHATMGI